MNNHQDEKKDKSEELFINNLFEKKEKDQNEQLYKNEFYILEEELKSKKNQNSLQFMHDILLNKLMLEDYVPFPPKNDEPTIVNNQKEEKKKEDEQDKLIEEENEFLRSLHKINYLTFSPFGLSFFEDNGKDKSTMNEDLLKEREDKILHMIDFNYDSFEVTNDLLLNICQGFVDINKLKEENLVKNKEKEKEKQKETINNNNNNKQDEKLVGKTDNDEKNTLDKNEVLFLEEIESKQNIDFYKDFITPCVTKFKEAKDKNERKNLMDGWKPLIQAMDKEYQAYLKAIEEKEKKEMEEQIRLKELEKKKKKEKEEEEKNNEKFFKALQEIIKKSKKKSNRSKSQDHDGKNNKQVKPRNLSNKMSPKKSTKSTKYSSSLTKKGTEGLGIFSVTTKYFNKNYSRSQEKIKTKPKNNFK